MTATWQWLDARRRELARRYAGAGVLGTAGLVLAAFAAGVVLARVGAYRTVPLLVVVGWGMAAAALTAGVWRMRRALRGIAVPALARAAEAGGHRRRGSIAGVAALEGAAAHAGLARAADRATARWLASAGAGALGGVRVGAQRAVRRSAVVFAAGALGFAVSGPLSGAGRAFWQPAAVLLTGRGPILLDADRTEVRRGETVRVRITAAGRNEVTFWSRAPGEPWSSRPLGLDSAGRAVVVLGPIESDRFVRASDGRRTSATLRVRVALPALLADLQLVARFPQYLTRGDEPLAPGADAVALPVGTRIITSGRATVPLRAVAWRSDSATVPLETDGQAFRGVLVVRVGATWQLDASPTTGGMDEAPPVLRVIAVPDSAPVVTVPVPGADTLAPVSLRLGIVVDARDDFGLGGVELVSWRVSRLGVRAAPVVEALPMPEGEADRVVLHAILDLNGRGFLPGDTAYYLAQARDRAPTPQIGASRTFALRLPSMSEVRRAVREAGEQLAAGADSVAAAQGALARELGELATERERGAAAREGGALGERGPDQLPFNSVQRARELSDREQSIVERARGLKDELRELSETAWQAGLTDPEFHRQLRDLERLLDRAVTDELSQRLTALREALERLDAAAARDALQQLAETAEQLREELERSRELFERAALEGDLTALAAEAEELAARQREWNHAAAQGVDSALAARESELASRTDSLAAQLGEVPSGRDAADATGQALRDAARRSDEAGAHMRQAARDAARGSQQPAQAAGTRASEALEPVSQEIRDERERLREEWRQDVLAQLDRALVETAELAQRQEEVAARMGGGDAGADVRGAQAAVREGVDRVRERLQNAAGKNALVSPQLGSALGFARLRMNETLEQLQRPTPNARAAGQPAGEALDALNALVHALLQSRSAVAGAQSGSGLAEAIEQMAQLAEQQGALTGQTGGLIPLLPGGGEQLLQQLRALAQRQQALADELDRLRARGETPGADELAHEARDIARQLDAGRLDRDVVERQERLFRRLLDAGRTLRNEEEDTREERVSRAADPSLRALPPATGTAPPGGPRFRYPTWDELRSLSAAERRLILDYFRRLNDGRP